MHRQQSDQLEAFMRRVVLSLGVACVIGAARGVSPGQEAPGPKFQFDKESRNPVTHLR